MSVARHRLAVLVVFFLAFSASADERAGAALTSQGSLQALFAPWDDIETRLVGIIDDADRQILVQAYLLTNKKIAKSLVGAHRRGVEVQILADARQHAKVSSSALPILAAAGIDIWLETKYQNAHNKIIVVDPAASNSIVVTGSFNFTWTAQHRNAENVLVIRGNSAVAAQYASNWKQHRRDATPYRD